MKPADWSALLALFARLGEAAADYRFGQLVCNVTSLVEEPGTVDVWEVGDDELLAAAREFLRMREARLRGRSPLSEDWQALILRLRQLHEEYPDVRFGQMIGDLATAVRGPETCPMWDVEDEELIAAADRWLAHRRRQHEAETELRLMNDDLPKRQLP